MSFVYEKLTDSRKNDYPELEGKYPSGWYMDKDRNICIWGGLAGGHWMPIAEGDYRWKFHLGINHEWYQFILLPGEGSKNFNENPYIIKWDSIVSIKSWITSSNFILESDLINYIKEALVAWGGGPAANKHISNPVIKFNF